jgi:glycosyltransferase involved in cell wall biosynthesis
VSRTLFITHSSAPSGAELSLLRLVRAWEGPKPAVIFGEPGGLVDEFADYADVLVLPLPDSLRSARRATALQSVPRAVVGLFRYSLQVRRAVRSVRADVVVGRSLKAVIYGRLATIGLSVTFVWSVHDRLTSEYLGRAAWFYSRALGRVCDAFIVNSMSTFSTVRTGRKPVLVLPPSLRATTHGPRRYAPGPVVVVLGRIAPWKGQDIALQAFARECKGTTATLTIVGSPMFGETDFLEMLESLAVSLGIGEQVRFAGQVAEPAEYLVEADVLLHSSRLPEPFGAVVIEGMDAGCVVIATQPGGPAEVITDGVNGFLAEAGDLESLVEALRRAIGLSSRERESVVADAVRTAQRFETSALTRVLEQWLVDVRRLEAPRMRRAVGDG